VSFEEVLSELEKISQLPRSELLEKIKNKCDELSGLITQEGAAYIVAREMGVNLINENKRRLQIKNIFSGMRNVNVIGRVFKISPTIDFSKKNGNKGRVCNIFIGDETGSFRIPLWNDQVKMIDDKTIQVGSVVQIMGGLAKDNIYGEMEISLGRFGSIQVIEDLQDFPPVEELGKMSSLSPGKRVSIKKLKEGDYLISGTVVHVFKGKFIFNTCSICGSSIAERKCSNHGEVKASPKLIVSGIIDDGTDDLRFVVFRDLAEKFIETTAEELAGLEQEKRYEIVKSKILGKQIQLLGKVRKANIGNRLEMIVSEVKALNVLDESKRLLEELEPKIR